MGLGLAVSQSIVIKHGGNIQICSAPEQGTSVLITLPLGLAGQESSRTENSGLLSDKPTILLLEDNPSLRKMCGQMLERLNCEVIYSGNGNEAIEKFNAAVKNKISIRLVLLDLNIKGGLGGIETLKRLRDSGYEKPVIVVSGSPDSPGIRDYQQFGFDGKLLRPYTKKELEKSIRQFIPF
jgi:CheY-like chemotaxis protein